MLLAGVGAKSFWAGPRNRSLPEAGRLGAVASLRGGATVKRASVLPVRRLACFLCTVTGAIHGFSPAEQGILGWCVPAW